MNNMYKKLFLIFTISICIFLYGCSQNEPKNYKLTLLDTGTIYIEQGDIKKLEVLTENINAEDLIWSSSAPFVASVKNGIITANNLGDTTITVKYNELSEYVFIKVIEHEVAKEVELYKIYTEYNEATNRDEEYIYIGHYPQTRIFSLAVISELEKLETTNEFGYYEYNGEQYAKVTIKNEYEGYRDWNITDEAYPYYTKFKVGEVAYFKVEPIKWRILYHDYEANSILLFSTSILDTCEFKNNPKEIEQEGKIIYPTNYEHSDVRKWLLNDFYNTAFNAFEDSIIIPTLIENDPTTTDYKITYPANDTLDKIFLPSYDDITNSLYGFESNGYVSKTRAAITSDYASSQGASSSALGDQYSSMWLLRWGLRYTKNYSSVVDYEGYAIEKSFYLDAPTLGIRVCMTIDASKVSR